MSPEKHIERAEQLLERVAAANTKIHPMSAADAIALAEAHIHLAQARHDMAIPE